MASIKISNLPALSADRLSRNDQFIVNDENQTTSRLSFIDFTEALGYQNYTFSGVVRFTGSVTIDVVDDTNSNVYTKASTNILIGESEARSKVLIDANAADINQLQNLLPAPTNGDSLFLSGTFRGAATTATQIVPAINLVADQSANTLTLITALEEGINRNTVAISDNTASIATLSLRVGANETLITQHDVAIADLEGRVSTLENTVGDVTDGLVEDVGTLTGQVADHETRLQVLEADPTTQTAVDAAQAKADAAYTFADLNNVEYRAILGDFGTDLTNALAAVADPATITGADAVNMVINAMASALANANNNHVAANGKPSFTP